MQRKLVIVGLGGQGVLFATRVLSETALAVDMDVIGAETHGMSQRGGSVISHLKLYHDDRNNASPEWGPLVRRGTADLLLALDPDEGYKALTYLKPGGAGFVNTTRSDYPVPQIASRLGERNIQLHTVDADGIAMELGSPTLANVALIGFAQAHQGIPFSYGALAETLAQVGTECFRAANLKALARGRALGRGHEEAHPL